MQATRWCDFLCDGKEVNVFLIENGVMWANKDRDLTLRTPTGDCPNDYLPHLVENHVPIGV